MTALLRQQKQNTNKVLKTSCQVVYETHKQSLNKNKPLDSFFSYLSIPQKLLFDKRKHVHGEFLKTKSSEYHAELKKLNRECRLMTIEAKNAKLENELKTFQDKYHWRETRGAYLVLKATLRSARLCWFERNQVCEVSRSEFRKHYEELFKDKPRANRTQVESEFPESWVQIQDRGPPSKAEVVTPIRGLNLFKSPGETQITSDQVKLVEKEISPCLTRIFGYLWENPGDIPQSRKDAKVLSFFNKGDKTVPGNYLVSFCWIL